MEQIEKMKTHLAAKRRFLEDELVRVKQAEAILSDNDDEALKTLLGSLEKNPSNYGLVMFSVRKAVESLQGAFNVRDVYTAIKNMPDTRQAVYPKTSIANCLIRLTKEGAIEQLKEGRGSIPSLYKAVSS